MKKIIAILVVLIVSTSTIHAQFLRGVGIFGAGNTSRDKYRNHNAENDTTMIHTIPAESHDAHEFFNWGAGIALEMLPFDRFRWQTELEYTHKGSIENELTNPYTESHTKGTNKFTYIEWNNFMKFRLEGNNFIYYGLIGVRAEYMLSKSTPAYTEVAGNFKKIWANPDVGIGTELISYGKFRVFSEIHYNPDLLKQYNKNNVTANNRTWELRVGVMFRPKRMLDIDCNAPRYSDPY